MSKAMQLKARIKNLASKNHIPAQAVLQNFMLERLLERISRSKYKDMFIIKGGLLIASLVGINSRTTMDMDATLRGYPLSEQAIQVALMDICDIQLEDNVIWVHLPNCEHKCSDHPAKGKAVKSRRSLVGSRR